MKTIVRKDTADDYAAYLKKLCEAAAIENPTVEDARRMDRARKSKKTSNKDWKSPADPDARIARLKDGRTRLGYKAEHVVDLDTGAVVAAEVYRAEEADTATLRPKGCELASKRTGEPSTTGAIALNGPSASNSEAVPGAPRPIMYRCRRFLYPVLTSTNGTARLRPLMGELRAATR